MNILEHILAGHYPTDSKGRPLVREVSGRHARICATDAPGSHCIMGFDELAQRAWNPAGDSSASSSNALLPPPPRKVKVTKRVIMYADGVCCVLRDDDPNGAGFIKEGRLRVVELTGEYEEPWS